MTVQRLAITAGEPAGIGPDLVAMLAASEHANELVVLADPDLVAQRAAQLDLDVQIVAVDLSMPATPSRAGMIKVLPIPLAAPVVAGQLDRRNAGYVLTMLQQAASGCLRGDFSAVVTAPVHKGIINDAGHAFSGHTEFFAEAAAVSKVVMMLATPSLRVALATTHLPLAAVSQAITYSELCQVIEIIHQAMVSQFGYSSPRIAVCGLNPHAGENGHLGQEEIQVITPAIEQAQRRGIAASGPWPADTIFVQSRLSHYDVVLAMFHDQGLPVLKHQGFGDAVNITLGLPFIRTSVDHGTALDLAATGKAEVSSLRAAVNLASELADKQDNQQ
ncbi:4-hydroxythreonine-4-phosphate dehydrogenase [Methylophaga frappieri]|uniref:4-hydroxythreonine-4-phosphate dehydrogenase n=1 Tax=Methylophaga frappieri (strain ATCC BAA-2434 / DSM 25690 / JAM7) TaxID=754477 RepID=I1YL39_METFJ|nr:4-hydroxythreonine-4-phosphate dehydrogenase PdxA [Methylophaga frappieri]AFJ03632.1 4-hydroxythreonine-4-phosphate dehydrogenase [Methylophaga frappieri]